MSNISFGVNILPKTSSVTIGNSEAPWKIHANQINGHNTEDVLLPEVSSSDNGKVLKVASGAWSIGSEQDVSGKLDSSLKGAVNGLAELDSNGKVPAAQLPSYVDDVIEAYYYNNAFYEEAAHTTQITPEDGKIYVDIGGSNKTYRWSGSAYTVIASDLALGETSSTAYRGDRGAAAYAAAVTNVESAPSSGSGNLITSGGVYTGLDSKADKTDTVLNTTLSRGRTEGSTVGTASFAFGNSVIASGNYTHAEGNGTNASAASAHAEGAGTTASGAQSHSEGAGTTASGDVSHAEGSNTTASGSQSHAEGYGGTYTSFGTTYTSKAAGTADHTEGYQCLTAMGQPGNHAEGYQTQATGGAAHSEGNLTVASASHSHAEGNSTVASGTQSHAEGNWTIASGVESHAEGSDTIAAGRSSTRTRKI